MNRKQKYTILITVCLILFGSFIVTTWLFFRDAKQLHKEGLLRKPQAAKNTFPDKEVFIKTP